ncbi:YD repeat-containing protein [Litoreibacter ponti]|uniref:YD repeat-containing protein n=1 Tax=Litoreibacter ponti TaxID=1510457 RepID=A0A2T6BKA6_9RHOB|nr:hypothetical protein [Litoreibacter ponti]PTX56488.1 YD repeat-containing protein [Litoreibacter ponti]
MKYLLLAGVCACLTQTAQADIRIQMAEIAPGSSVTYLVSDGTRRTHHFEGEQDGVYVVTYWNGRGKGLDGGLYGTARYDSDGRMLSLTRPGGKVTTYTPHNCFRVVGECRYTAKNEKGRVWQYGRRITETETGFTFENFRLTATGQEAFVTKGAVTLDEMGMMDELTLERSADAKLSAMTQERADYR